MGYRCGNIEGGLRIGTDGKFYPCCLAYDYPYMNDEGRLLKADVDTFEDALNSKSATDLKQALARGEKHSACHVCWEAEEAGFESKRIRDTQRFDRQEDDKELIFLEINLGNTCNLACRICGIHASSTWRKDYAKIYDNLKSWEVNERVKEYNKSFLDDSLIWSELDKHISKVRILDLYGGEPMLMKKQWELLQYCVDKGYSKKQFVHFNTNGTIFNTEYADILKHFEHARISFSADGVNEGFNYTRHPGKWNEVEANIKSWLRYTKGLKNFSYEVTYTTSILNVLHCHDMAKWILDHNLSTQTSGDHIITLYVAFVFGPPSYCIKNIPPEAKLEVIQKVKEKAEVLKQHPAYKNHSYVYDECMKISQTLENADEYSEHEFGKFFYDNDRLDKWRKEDFSSVFPELFTILNKYRPPFNYTKIV
jgi:MoaA/NifB/PqqE/SkfB family radical SAM enzyme